MLLPVKCANSLVLADFNNDGLLDIFTGSYSDARERELESYIYWNHKDRGFSAKDRQCLQTHAAGGSLAADFNEDGWIDLAVANHKVLGDHTGYSEVWWNGPQGFSPERTTKLPTVGTRGPTIVHPGNIADRGDMEYYTSEPFEIPDWRPESGVVRSVSWDGTVPPKTWVHAEIRSATNKDDLVNAQWLESDDAPGHLDSGESMTASFQRKRVLGPWIQYRLALGAVNGCRTPRITAVRVAYDVQE